MFSSNKIRVSTNPMIKLEDIHKSYKMGNSYLHALKGINFEVESGELVAIMGSV